MTQCIDDGFITCGDIGIFWMKPFQELIEATIGTIAVFDYSLNHDVQKVHFISDLRLQQKSLLRVDSFPEVYNYSIDIGEKTLSEVLSENARKKCERSKDYFGMLIYTFLNNSL